MKKVEAKSIEAQIHPMYEPIPSPWAPPTPPTPPTL